MSNLWPKGIGKERINSPNSILREQASFLGTATGNLVQGSVIMDEGDGDHFRYYFHIVSPSLNNYHYKLMTVYHEIEMYPVYIFVEDNILKEISGSVTVEQIDQYEDGIIARSEEEFSSVLKNIFSSTKAKKVVTALLSQADPDWNTIPF